MEIISNSFINNEKYRNIINIKDGFINCIIDYGNIKSFNIKNRNYILLDEISKCFKEKTLEKELQYYEKFISQTFIEKMLELFSFDKNFCKKNINTMSSSELRLSYIFINLLFDDNIIILDNVTKNLDSENIRKIIYILKELKKLNKTIIIKTNDVEFIHKISDYVIVIDSKMICSGDKYEVFTKNELKVLPNVIKFSKKVKDKKNIKIGYRDDIKDLMKDIYRYVS